MRHLVGSRLQQGGSGVKVSTLRSSSSPVSPLQRSDGFTLPSGVPTLLKVQPTLIQQLLGGLETKL